MARSHLIQSKIIPAAQDGQELDLGTFHNVYLGKIKFNQGKMQGDYSSNVAPLLLNPETWQDTKSTNWAVHNIPGQSDPVLQYVSGAPRVVAFEALVTNDTSYYPIAAAKKGPDIAGAALNAIGSIASNFFGANIPPLGDLFGKSDSAEDNFLDISDNLNYYRSFLYPSYKNNRLSGSPPLAILATGKTLSLNTPNDGDDITTDHDIWVLTDLDIKVTKQLPNLTPMEATVSFKFVEYRIAPKSSEDVFGSPTLTTPSSSGQIPGRGSLPF